LGSYGRKSSFLHQRAQFLSLLLQLRQPG
jgi:hypothetical protein